MKDLKVLILLFYYDRPEMVKINALKSIENSTYKNYEIAFINDSGESTSDHLLTDLKDKTKVKQYNIGISDEEKQIKGGSIFGNYANLAIKESDAEIVIMLCDDDALLPDYLENLNKFYQSNPYAWSYSKVKYYNPEIEDYTKAEDDYANKRGPAGSTDDLNRNNQPLNPFCRCDASQVSFRTFYFKDRNVWFPFPQTRNLDASIYQSMYNAVGPCYPNSFYGQCKGVFADQLGSRASDFKVTIK
jgi:hypothetical protein